MLSFVLHNYFDTFNIKYTINDILNEVSALADKGTRELPYNTVRAVG